MPNFAIQQRQKRQTQKSSMNDARSLSSDHINLGQINKKNVAKVLQVRMTRNNEHEAVSSSLKEIDDDCHRLRRELDTLRKSRSNLRKSRSKEIELLEYEHQSAKEKLHLKLPEHANLSTYSKFLRYYQRDLCNNQKNNTFTTSNYIIH